MTAVRYNNTKSEKLKCPENELCIYTMLWRYRIGVKIRGPGFGDQAPILWKVYKFVFTKISLYSQVLVNTSILWKIFTCIYKDILQTKKVCKYK